MAVSVEVYFLTNFLMDFAATAIVARSLGRVRWRRVMLAAALGAVWATLAQLPLLRFLASFGGAAAMAFVLAAVAMPPDSLRSALRAGAALLGGGLFLGGVQLAALRLFAGAGAAAFIAGALLGAMALLAAAGARQKRLVTWEVQVFLSAAGGGEEDLYLPRHQPLLPRPRGSQQRHRAQQRPGDERRRARPGKEAQRRQLHAAKEQPAAQQRRARAQRGTQRVRGHGHRRQHKGHGRGAAEGGEEAQERQLRQGRPHGPQRRRQHDPAPAHAPKAAGDDGRGGKVHQEVGQEVDLHAHRHALTPWAL